MKRCPECRRDYHDDSLLYCLDDGVALVEGPTSPDEAATAILSKPVAGEGLSSDPSGTISLTGAAAGAKKKDAADHDPEAILRRPGRFDPRSFGWGAILFLVIGAASFGVWYFNVRGPVAAARNIRFPLVIPDGAVPYADVETHSLSISPDGRYIAFIATVKGQRTIWIRPLDSLDAHSLSGSENAQSIFWSPDSNNIAFFADGKLKRIEASGKSLQTICNLPAAGDASGSWGSRGVIVFFDDADSKIYSVPAAGGSPAVVAEKETGRYVRFLPDGNRFLFVGNHESTETAGIYAGSLDSNETKQIAKMAPARPQYINGYLIYPKDGTLVAQPFDQKTLALSGEPTVLVERLPYFDKTGWAEFSASESGPLVYMTEFPKTRLVWLDRKGSETSQVGSPGNYVKVRLSPDGQRVAMSVEDPRTLSGDIWIEDLAHGTSTVFVSGQADDDQPVWSPDGGQVAYFSCCVDKTTVHIKEIGSVGNPRIPQLKDQDFAVPMDWSPDGRSVIYDWDGLWILPLADGAEPYQFIKNVHMDSGARFSPDGKWVAFASDETGRDEIYVSKLDQPGEKRRISADGGSNPRWSRNGRELFYLSPDSNLMSAEIKPGIDLNTAQPTPLFKVDPLMTSYDVRADGQAFLCVVSAPGTQLFPYAVTMDWTAEIKK